MNDYSIDWTNKAYDDLLEIQENVPKKYANTLISGFFDKTEILRKFPKIGQVQLTFLGIEYRYLIYKEYKIIYSISKQKIIIQTVFNIKQDPNKMFS